MNDMRPRPVGAGGDGDEGLGQEAVEERLRRLSSACAVPAAAAAVTVGALAWTAERDGGAGMLVQPPAGSFLLALGALLMVLLSSGVHRRILRRAVDAAAGEETVGEAQGLAGPGVAELAAARGGVAGERGLLAAYTWATGVSFGMLGVAVVAGALVGLGGGAPFYGLVICLASLLAMVVRWPRRGHFDVALERDSLAAGEQQGPGGDGGNRV
jgi:hypothetical protein